MSDATNTLAGRPESLGETLRQARDARGLTLAEVSERTHVRATYLEALETGAYDRLPEEIYTRNFLRLYARAVGVEPEEALRRYDRERGAEAAAPRATGSAETGAAATGAAGTGPWVTGREGGSGREDEAGAASGGSAARAAAPSARPDTAGRAGPLRRLPPSVGPLLATLVLAGALVGVAVWGFNRLLFRPDQNLAADPPPPSVEGTPNTPAPSEGGVAGAPATDMPDEVELSVRTEPAGAEVSIDAFPLPGTTPIDGVPVTARADRTVRITREGYQPFEESLDLTADRALDVTLEPLPPAGEPVDEADAAAEGDERLVIEVNEPSWLEVYRGSARGEGEPLVYTTAQPGERYAYEELPVYVHLGNAAGVDITLDGEPQEDLAAAGAVTGRAFDAP